MIVRVNHQNLELATAQSVTALLQLINQSAAGIAVAINQQIITKSEWENHLLQENDEVLIIQATQGG